MDLGSGNTLRGTLDLPAGFVYPQAYSSAGTTGTATITGGTREFQGATGSFPVITGSAVATGSTSASFNLSSSGSVTAGHTDTFTASTSSTKTLHPTNATAEVNLYSTRITARVGAGPLLFDQTLSVPFTDASVQTAIQQARTQLTNAGATSFTGPTQQSNARTLSGTSQSTVVNSTQTTITPNTEVTFGPADILIGNRDTGGTPYHLVPSETNYNTNTNTQSDIFQTITTTSNYLTSQTYELNGTAAPAPPATPVPPSFWLALTGGAAVGLSAINKRFRNRKKS